MKTLEIVFGNSCYMSMKKSSLQSNDILLFNLLLNVGDLSKIEENKINIPKELCNEKGNYLCKKEILMINNAIIKKEKIRIWTSNYNIYSFLIMLYICNIVKNQDCVIYVVYSDDYNKYYTSPSLMSSIELEELSRLEHKLTKDEIIKYSNMWEEIVKINSEMWVLENGIVKSVSINYYDNMIFNKLKKLGQVKISKLVAMLMKEIYLTDILYVYLIKILIENDKIRIVKIDDNRFFNSVIELG